jgi:hypothetical protein
VSDIPDAEMNVRGLPGRGLCYVRYLHELGLEALCDCGTVTILTVDPGDIVRLPHAQETSYTCDTCQSTHWLTIKPLEEQL